MPMRWPSPVFSVIENASGLYTRGQYACTICLSALYSPVHKMMPLLP